MNDDVRQSIKALRELSPILNEATDEANEVVGLVEKFLNEECSVGLPCYLTVQESHGEVGGQPYIGIGYDRVASGTFRIVVLIEEPDEHYNENLEQIDRWTNRSKVAWVETAREIKLQTFAKLPELLREIADRVCETVKTTAQTSDTVKTLLNALRFGNDTPVASQPKTDLVADRADLSP